MGIPQRQPYGEVFTGVLLRVDTCHLLASQPHLETEIVQQGKFVLRYAISYLEKPQFSIVPGLVALDYGDILVGGEAWEFLFKRSNLYPRADVVGYRNDGFDEIIPVKKLDFMQPIVVLAYADDKATTPLAHIHGIIASDAGKAACPEWLREYGQFYESVAAFHAQQNDNPV